MNSFNESIMTEKSFALNSIKNHTLNGLRRQAQFDKEFDLLQANDQSLIDDVSEHEESKDEILTGVLANFHPPMEDNIAIQEEPQESSSSHINKDTSDNEFEPKRPNLMIDCKEEEEESESELDGDNESNYSPWVNKIHKKLSPFENYKRKLIIHTDSMDSGNMKLKANGNFLLLFVDSSFNRRF